MCGTTADYRTLREDELVSIYLTCTVDPISTVTWVAKAGETPFCVSTLCICMTVVQIRALTLINICTTTKLSIKGGPCNLHCGRNIVDLWYCSPLQFKPFWSNRCPSWQLQVELPMVSVQSCSHPPFAVSHSLMSVMQQVIVVPWLLNGYGYCTIRGLLMYFWGQRYIINPKMVQAIPIKKPWYSWLVSATPIVRLLLMNGLHCCLATSCTMRQLGSQVPPRWTWDLYPSRLLLTSHTVWYKTFCDHCFTLFSQAHSNITCYELAEYFCISALVYQITEHAN